MSSRAKRIVVTEATIKIKVWDPDLRRFVERSFEGKLFHVAGTDIALYPIPVMAAAIGRERETLIRWEGEGTWPASMWKVPDGRCKRWYSRAQIEAVARVHWDLAGGHTPEAHGLAHSRHFPLDTFFKQVKAIFYKVDAINVTQGAATP